MTTDNTPQQAEANKNITQVIYGLYAASLIVGITYIVAIILNYVKRDDVKGTYLESHFVRFDGGNQVVNCYRIADPFF